MARTEEQLKAGPAGAGRDGSAESPTQGRRRRVIIPVVTVLVIIGLFFGIRYLVFAAHHVSTDDAQITGDITTVAPRVKGQVANVYVSDNQYVKRGTVLVKIDPSDYQVAVQQAQAALAQAIAADSAAQSGVPLQSAVTQAQTAQAQAGVTQAGSQAEAAVAQLDSARNKLVQAEAQERAAAAQASKAADDERRALTLVAEGAIARSDYDGYHATYVSAIANLVSARQGVDVANQGVVAAQAQVGQAQAGISASDAQLMQAETGTQQTTIKQAQAQTASAQVSAAKAALAAAQLQLSYTTIVAPIDGVVSKKSVNVGDNVASGQPLMAITDTNGLYIVANLKETQITNVRVSQPVDITVDAYPHQVFAGTVASLSPATGATFALIPPDNASGNFTKVVQRVPVRINIDRNSDPQGLLKQGLSVEVSIDTTNH
ncbi:MAG TPA: HlyD family secretion protein [Candidatus Eremiobacteraceae bacterium]|nr:HlyD family secretion protein [Candidatus Eremiobacteraceae bacterium]